MYTGTLIQDLTDYATRVRANSERICQHCRQPFGEHSYVGEFCPQPFPKPMRTTRFKALQCSANIGGGENPSACERLAIPGSDFCAAHTEE